MEKLTERILIALWLVASALISSSLHAQTGTNVQAIDQADIVSAYRREGARNPKSLNREFVRAIIEQETSRTSLPADVAEAVVFVESSYDAAVVGRVGEVGLMQVRPETAAMLGFKGSAAELAKPETNIHYGVTYLSKAWRLAGGDLCRALMKYRAGHGEQAMTARSITYCNRARNRLVAMGSPFADTGVLAMSPPHTMPAVAAPVIKTKAAMSLVSPKGVYAIHRRGTPAASRAFWVAHEARVAAIKARIESKWRRVAAR